MRRIVILFLMSFLVGMVHAGLLAEYWGRSAAPTWGPIPGLVAHWEMNDNAANPVVLDSFGTNNGTAMTNTSVLTFPGKINGALTNSPTQYTIGTFSSFPTTNISVMCWANCSTASVYGVFFMIGGASSGELMWYWRNDRHKAGLSGNFGAGWGDNDPTATIPDPRGDWHHFAATWNGANIYYYFDGAQVGNAVVKTGTIVSTYNTFWIGREGSWNSMNSYELIDDVRVYNRALTAAEILRIAAGTESE